MIALLFSKALLKRVMYIHFLILLIGFEGFLNPQNTFKNISWVVFIGCLLKKYINGVKRNTQKPQNS